MCILLGDYFRNCMKSGYAMQSDDFLVFQPIYILGSVIGPTMALDEMVSLLDGLSKGPSCTLP